MAKSGKPDFAWGEGGVRGLRSFRIALPEPLIPPSPAEVGFIRLRPCFVAKSGRPDFAWGEGVKHPASLTTISSPPPCLIALGLLLPARITRRPGPDDEQA